MPPKLLAGARLSPALAASLIALVSLAGAAEAMRHPQASLWALAQEAEVIAVGQVAEIIEGSGTSTRTARIHVAEYLAR